MHLTGRYPDWWTGRRFPGKVRAVAGSESSELTREGVQRLLLGEPEDESQWGIGLIPKDALVEHRRKVQYGPLQRPRGRSCKEGSISEGVRAYPV